MLKHLMHVFGFFDYKSQEKSFVSVKNEINAVKLSLLSPVNKT